MPMDLPSSCSRIQQMRGKPAAAQPGEISVHADVPLDTTSQVVTTVCPWGDDGDYFSARFSVSSPLPVSFLLISDVCYHTRILQVTMMQMYSYVWPEAKNEGTKKTYLHFLISVNGFFFFFVYSPWYATVRCCGHG
jgi:hypothetical protein